MASIRFLELAVGSSSGLLGKWAWVCPVVCSDNWQCLCPAICLGILEVCSGSGFVQWFVRALAVRGSVQRFVRAVRLSSCLRSVQRLARVFPALCSGSGSEFLQLSLGTGWFVRLFGHCPWVCPVACTGIGSVFIPWFVREVDVGLSSGSGFVQRFALEFWKLVLELAVCLSSGVCLVVCGPFRDWRGSFQRVVREVAVDFCSCLSGLVGLFGNWQWLRLVVCSGIGSGSVQGFAPALAASLPSCLFGKMLNPENLRLSVGASARMGCCTHQAT